MSADWTSWPDEARRVVAEVVSDLLHDWIKYMEMRLLSIDWSAPPTGLEALVDKAIRQTRRQVDGVRSVRQIWSAGRERLATFAGKVPIDDLIASLDSDVDSLEALADEVRRRADFDPDETDTMIRRAGRRLRGVRDALAELEKSVVL